MNICSAAFYAYWDIFSLFCMFMPLYVRVVESFINEEYILFGLLRFRYRPLEFMTKTPFCGFGLPK
jgi:hypothetical protein